MSENILDTILGGSFDNELDTITSAIKQRKTILANRLISSLDEGDRVKFNNTTRPRYLVGVEGTVKKINGKSVSIDLDMAHGRFFKNIRVPSSLVELV